MALVQVSQLWPRVRQRNRSKLHSSSARDDKTRSCENRVQSYSSSTSRILSSLSHLQPRSLARDDEPRLAELLGQVEISLGVDIRRALEGLCGYTPNAAEPGHCSSSRSLTPRLASCASAYTPRAAAFWIARHTSIYSCRSRPTMVDAGVALALDGGSGAPPGSEATSESDRR